MLAARVEARELTVVYSVHGDTGSLPMRYRRAALLRFIAARSSRDLTDR